MRQKWLRFLWSCCFIFLGCTSQKDFQALKGPYLGQKPPGSRPKVFAPAIISKENFAEYGGHFSPDGREFYFTRHSPGNRAQNGPCIFSCGVRFEGSSLESALSVLTHGSALRAPIRMCPRTSVCGHVV